MNFSAFIARNFVHLTLKTFSVSPAYLGSTASHIQVNINIFMNIMTHTTSLYTRTIVFHSYIVTVLHVLELRNKNRNVKQKIVNILISTVMPTVTLKNLSIDYEYFKIYKFRI